MATRGRPPRHEVGEEPDARFSFANERTFLAWMRTALALILTGLAVVQFLKVAAAPARLVIAVPLIGLGAVIAVMSLRRWDESERAIRLGRPLPRSRSHAVVALGIGAIALLAGVFVIVDAIAGK